MKKINSELIRKWIKENGKEGKALFSKGARISESMIEKLVSDNYFSMPRKAVREDISKAMGVEENKIFPK